MKVLWVYLNVWTNVGSEFATPEQGKDFIITSVRKRLILEVQPTKVLTSVLLVFICRGT